MAEFCKECCEETWGADTKDLAELCEDEQVVLVLCEGCGPIYVDHTGRRVCHVPEGT